MEWIRRVVYTVALATGLQVGNGATMAQYAEESTVQAAAAVLNATMAIPAGAIPKALLENAYGVAIIPQVIKGSFVIGARHGQGVLCVRDPSGTWHAPVFITLTGGNIGWQVGLQSSDLVLVFKTQGSVNSVLAGTLTLGADVAAAAGPVGRQASMATDGQLQAEVYSYSRSRGLFAGVSFDGSVIRVDQLATGSYYRSPAPGEPVVVPPSAVQLTQAIASLASPDAVLVTLDQQNAFYQQHSLTEVDMLRNQLAQTAPKLFELLDANWRGYLAMPEFIFNSSIPIDLKTLNGVVANYETVAGDGRYRDLALRPEFQSVYGLLKHFVNSLNPISVQLNLPPPPASSAILPP